MSYSERDYMNRISPVSWVIGERGRDTGRRCEGLVNNFGLRNSDWKDKQTRYRSHKHISRDSPVSVFTEPITLDPSAYVILNVPFFVVPVDEVKPSYLFLAMHPGDWQLTEGTQRSAEPAVFHGTKRELLGNRGSVWHAYYQS
jgi:hypothetical protein